MAEDRALRKRQRAFRRGIIAEYWAAAYLMMKGYRIQAMRFRAKTGEIDIIARKKELIAFVEVKARRSEADALFAVGRKSQHRIHSASLIWISKQKDAADLSWRYDIVAVMPWRIPVHYEGAF